MKDWAVLLIGVGVIGLLAWSGCNESQQQQAWRADRDSTLQAVQARQDSADRLLTYAESLTAQAEGKALAADQRFRQGERMVRSALHYRDSVLLTLGTPPDTCAPFLLIARLTQDSLVGALRVTRQAFDSLQAAQEPLRRSNTALLHAYQLQRESVDSLVGLVGRTPTGGCRAFGVPCPVVTIGYGAVLSGGIVRSGPVLGVGWRVSF